MTELRYRDIQHGSEAVSLEVLVVDDHELNRRVMRLLLHEFGCRAAFAASGDEGIEQAATQAFDLIFMDLNMPGIDGDEATRSIRAAGPSKASFIVRWTTEASLRLDRALYDAQAPKPLCLSALADLIAEAARRRLARRTPSRSAAQNLSPI
jgi:CheY-like chemotaxis protein